MGKVAAALKSRPRATRGRYRTSGQAAALHPYPPLQTEVWAWLFFS